MAKNVLPTTKFDAELAPGTVTAAIKTLHAEKVTSGDGSVIRVPHENLRILPDFNIRIRSGEYDEQVEDLMKSIRSEGFIKTRPLTGFVAKESDGDVIYLTDGHRRYEAVGRLLAEGVEIGPLPVILAPSNMTMEDHLVGLATSNSGQPLTMFEKALLAKRLDNMGIEKSRIASRLGMTDRHLGNMLFLSGAPAKIRNAIIDGKISTTEALKQMRTKGKDAGDAIEAGIEKAEKSGKKKATAKTLGGGESTAGDDDAEDGDKASIVTKNGKVHETIQVSFKKGQIVPSDNMLAFARFKGGDWYNWVDKKTKKDAFIEYDITFLLKMTTKADQVEVGEEQSADHAETLADQTFEDAGETGDAAPEGDATVAGEQQGGEGAEESAPAPVENADDEL